MTKYGERTRSSERLKSVYRGIRAASKIFHIDEWPVLALCVDAIK
jgi:hypothetical protein